MNLPPTDPTPPAGIGTEVTWVSADFVAWEDSITKYMRPAARTIRFREDLPSFGAPVTEGEALARITALEQLKNAASAEQAVLAVALKDLVIARHAALGLDPERRGKDTGSMVALARAESPNKGGRLLGLAAALVTEMPHAHRLMTLGLLGEWKATLLVRETACLSAGDRLKVDEMLCQDPTTLQGVGERKLIALARKMSYALDARAVADRASHAVEDRRVSLRPAPDTMTIFHALLPVRSGVAVYAVLNRQADACKARGDKRSRSQIMADTLVERVTGVTDANAIPVELQLVITDRALFAGDAEPAHLAGYGLIPAAAAREYLRAENQDGTGALAGLRRIYTAPGTGELVALESKRRAFPQGLKQFISIRDQFCRAPYCDAPIQHMDHVEPVARGGATTAENAEGTCARCNYTKEFPGWVVEVVGNERHAVRWTDPSGNSCRSTAPPQPG
ncbi:HNH endonuclease [Paeniglutamicibacter cryotolerans]|uniref:HNH nuclease domain-containing protein n=1 Tax=Paeniglutamicibacter cryotolerans TaxID=670079 RepID=A0A839QM61_9MICC|nr:HNH endonuclease signature motif containing protein [Paeniglutamicibacter cryotolerans]MBB2995834.1 hypothetical protein [Paeniglutamicibacter cryotolerans]